MVALARLGAIGAMLCCSKPPAARPMAVSASTLIGLWDVVRVAVDENNQPRWVYRPDDPQLLGREVSIRPDVVEVDEDRCSKPRWTEKIATWQAFLAAKFHRPASSGGLSRPGPADFALDVKPTAQIKVFALKCSKSEDRTFLDGAWFVAVDRNRLMVNLDEHALVVLERRKLTDVPTPTFDCRGADKPVEHMICSSISLAAWDRSVALQLARKVEAASPEEQRSIKLEQAAWLKERDDCKHEACIVESYRQRIWQLR